MASPKRERGLPPTPQRASTFFQVASPHSYNPHLRSLASFWAAKISTLFEIKEAIGKIPPVFHTIRFSDDNISNEGISMGLTDIIIKTLLHNRINCRRHSVYGVGNR